jgi:hypothetical protein
VTIEGVEDKCDRLRGSPSEDCRGREESTQKKSCYRGRNEPGHRIKASDQQALTSTHSQDTERRQVRTREIDQMRDTQCYSPETVKEWIN